MKYAIVLTLLCAALYAPSAWAIVTSCVQCTYTDAPGSPTTADGCKDGNRVGATCDTTVTYTSCRKSVAYDAAGFRTVTRSCNRDYSTTGVTRCLKRENDNGMKSGQGYECYCTGNDCNGAAGLTVGIMMFLAPLFAKFLW